MLESTYEDEERIFQVCELVTGGDLTDSMNTDYQVSERNVQKIMSSLFDAVIYMHSKGIAHRDLKPDILLLTEGNLKESRLKISDFSVAIQLEPGEFAHEAVGTPFYVAPEIISEKDYDQKCDLWSLGVILFLTLSGSLPFFHENTEILFELIKAGKYSFEDKVWD
jgi:calcium-dependent protein kinase